MSFVFNMPEIGEGVVEAEVVEWKVAVGEAVRVDQPLAEVLTDKANVEIPSPRAGVVLALHAEPGDFVAVHSPLLELGEAGDAPTVARESAPALAPAPAPPPEPEAVPLVDAPVPGDTRAAPAVRRYAREQGVDVHEVEGSGPSGRVTREDVDRHAATLGAAPSADPVLPAALPQVSRGREDQRVRIIGLRRRIAEQMLAAKRQAPHFTYVEEVDATRLVELRTQLKARAEAQGTKLSYLAFVAKACSVAFRDHPNVNAVMDEERFELVVKGRHHIGIATDTPRGLYVPVVKDVQDKSILQISADIQAVVERTRAGTASLDDLTGSSFTITSVGGIGGVLATPVLNVPEVAILGFNSIRDRAVVRDGQVVVRKMTYLSPTFDHRVIDGAVGARFVSALKALLEEPEGLLLELA